MMDEPLTDVRLKEAIASRLVPWLTLAQTNSPPDRDRHGYSIEELSREAAKSVLEEIDFIHSKTT